jgi:AraC family transcriptional regulator, regulatory protein of adaptative response / methylated-DNA-[protein]-cysteine methyltransferase
MEIKYGFHKTPFGLCLIGVTKEKIYHLSFPVTKSIAALKKAWPDATPIQDQHSTKKYIENIFSLKKKMLIVMQGTYFQKKVWNALLNIPAGTTTSYAAIAKKVGSPKAVRAVGTACGKNSIGFLIPCHRVLTSKGKLGGYRWGTKRKESMLAWESFLMKNDRIRAVIN